MKKLKLGLLLAITLLPIYDLLGQNCVQLIRTKYDSSSNNQFNTLYPGKINPWLNSFNIGANDGIGFYDIPLNTNAGWASGTPASMKNPYSQGVLPEYAYLQEPIGGGVNDMDYHWEDGWEVMWLNTGFFPNGEGIHLANSNRILNGFYSLSNPKTPYMILYNRYTGKLRVFANLIANYNVYQDARIVLKHPLKDYSTGIFRHMTNYDRALEDSTEIDFAASTNHNNLNNATTWWSTDFQLAYDPCICNHTSFIDFRIYTVKTYDVDLIGRSVSSNFPISTINSNPDYTNFLTNEGLREGLETGSVIYKSLSGMLDDYEDELDSYNTRLKSYNSPFNTVIREGIKAVKTKVQTSGGAFVADAIGDIALRSLVMYDGPSANDSSTAKKWSEEASKFAKGELGKRFDFVSIAALGKEFFEEPVRPSMPTATFTDMRFSGTISDSGQVFVGSLITPGAYKYPQTLTPFNYPAYNEVPGFFALLRTPKLEHFEERSNNITFLSFDTLSLTTLLDSPLTIQSNEEKIELWRQDHKFFYRLKEALKYKLNRTLDFDDEATKLQACLVIELENGMPDTLNCFRPNIVNRSKNLYLRDVFPAINGHSWLLNFESPWKDLSTIGEVLFDLDFSNSFTTNSTRTVTSITDSNNVTTVSVGDWDDCVADEVGPQFHVSKIKLKIGADMYFKQKGTNGLQNNNFQTYTYLLYDKNNEANPQIYDVYDTIDIMRYKAETVSLTNETIETTDPFVFETVGTDIYVNAKNIELNGTIAVQSGYNAIIQATESIKGISSVTTLPQNVHLKTVGGFSPFAPIAEVTPTELQSFCTNISDGYKANKALNKWGGEEQEEKEEQLFNPKSIVYPNPAKDVFNVVTNINETKAYNFKVFDLLGKVLINENVAGMNQPQFEINASHLAAGTYLLSVSTSDGSFSETHRIVILD